MKENGPHLISKAVELCLKMPELSVPSPGTVGMKEQFEAWGSQILDNHEFASNLMNLFLKCVFTNKVFTAKSLNTKYERMWTNFHCFASSIELSTLWSDSGLSNTSTARRFFVLFRQAVTK